MSSDLSISGRIIPETSAKEWKGFVQNQEKSITTPDLAAFIGAVVRAERGLRTRYLKEREVFFASSLRLEELIEKSGSDPKHLESTISQMEQLRNQWQKKLKKREEAVHHLRKLSEKISDSSSFVEKLDCRKLFAMIFVVSEKTDRRAFFRTASIVIARCKTLNEDELQRINVHLLKMQHHINCVKKAHKETLLQHAQEIQEKIATGHRIVTNFPA